MDAGSPTDRGFEGDVCSADSDDDDFLDGAFIDHRASIASALNAAAATPSSQRHCDPASLRSPPCTQTKTQTLPAPQPAETRQLGRAPALL